MSFVGKVVVVVLIATLATTGGVAAESAVGKRGLTEQVEAIYEKAQHQDCRSSLSISQDVMRRAEFAALPEPTRAAIYEVASFCASEIKDPDASYRYAVDGTRLKGADAQLWRTRLGRELEDKRNAQAVETVEALALQNVEVLDGLPIQWLYLLNRNVKHDVSLQRRLLAVLTAPAYQPEEALVTGDPFKRDYATLLADTGDKAAAAALVARIDEPSVLVDVSVDPRLRGMLQADFDARAATEWRLIRAREIAVSHSGSMSAVLEMAHYLRELGRAEDALATLEAASPEGVQAKTFNDLDQELSWWWDGMARTYEMLGRYEEAVAAFRKGIEDKENGGLNVSQTINLGHAQLRFGHPVEALATVAVFESSKYSASPYGEMELHLVRGCAQFALNQAAAAKVDLAYAAAHEHDHPEAYMDLLLCAGDIEGAAAAAIRRLDDADRRSQALLQLSDYDAPPASYPQESFDLRLAGLKARPDVQAAIMRAGGTRRFHLQAGEL